MSGYVWVTIDRSNGDGLNPILPTYIWVYDTKKEVQDLVKLHRENTDRSKLSAPFAVWLPTLKLAYRPVPRCVDSHYWKRKEAVR